MKTAIKHTLAVIALFASTLVAHAQVKIGSNPTTPEATSNLEVEASTPNRKVKVEKTTGQLTIKDGTEGNLKILTSDAVGGASWQALKTTSITSFSQTAGITLNMPTAIGAGFCSFSVNPPACAVDMNQNATFSIVKSTNDVIIDVTDSYSINPVTAPVAFRIGVYVDVTTPGVFELIGQYFVSVSIPGCSGGSLATKFVIKDLPVRAYSVKTYAAAYTNGGAPVTVGLGLNAIAGCGAGIAGNNTIVSVSQ